MDCESNQSSEQHSDETRESRTLVDQDDEIQPEPHSNINGSTAADEDDSPLYPGAQVSSAESALLTLTFALRHDLSGECLSDLLQLIELHCPVENSYDTSLYLFRKYFKGIKSPLRCHKFCNRCDMYIGDDKGITCCPNAACGKKFKSCESLPYFLEIPLDEQLNNLFKRPGFHESLLHRFNSEGNCPMTINDIHDGSLYRSKFQPGEFLSDPNNISFMWYVDGAQLFKSSKGSLWVVYFAINELPCGKRMNPDNVILGGLWFNEGKPCMSSYLKPFCDSLSNFYSDGFTVNCSHCQGVVNIKGTLLCGTCDLPAKAGVMNMTQFNGQHGCAKCLQPGQVVAAGRGHTRVYPFDAENLDGPARTNEDTIKNAIEATATGKPVQGIKGPSWFSALEGHDLIKGTGVDYMHGVLLGVVRQMLRLWFESKHSSMPFSCSKLVDVVDERLLSIKPPHCISRLPRSIKNHMAYWKANELRAWLFYYSVPVLCGILPDDYFQHHLLLVEAIHLLCKTSIHRDDLVHCRHVIIHYVSTFGALYTDRHMTMNVHSLLHLVDVVETLGPLWVYSCFAFESLNGKLLKLVHGANKPVLQIANAVTYMLRIPELAQKLVPDSKSAQLYHHLSSSKHTNATAILPNVFLLGKLKKTTDEQYISAVNQTGFSAKSMSYFLRAKVHGRLICSKQYSALKSRISSIVHLDDGSFASVQVFLKACSCDNNCLSETQHTCTSKYYALVNRLSVATASEVGLCRDDLTSVCLPHVCLVVKRSDAVCAIPITAILDVCVYVNITLSKDDLQNLEFILVPPNYIESD